MSKLTKQQKDEVKDEVKDEPVAVNIQKEIRKEVADRTSAYLESASNALVKVGIDHTHDNYAKTLLTVFEQSIILHGQLEYQIQSQLEAAKNQSGQPS